MLKSFHFTSEEWTILDSLLYPYIKFLYSKFFQFLYTLGIFLSLTILPLSQRTSLVLWIYEHHSVFGPLNVICLCRLVLVSPTTLTFCTHLTIYPPYIWNTIEKYKKKQLSREDIFFSDLRLLIIYINI